MSLRWEKKPAALPKPPTDVRAELHDGTVVPCECRYEGLVEGLHTWLAVTPVPADRVRAVTAAVLPAHTQIVLKVSY